MEYVFSRGCPDGLFVFVSQCEVELSLLYIGSCHLDAYCIAQLVFVVMTSANETIVLLVEVVVVVVEVAHRYQTLAVVLVYLAVDAIRLDA